MFTRQRWTLVSLATLSLATLSACGAIPANGGNNNQNPYPWPTWTPPPSPSPTPTPDEDEDQDLDPDSGLPPIAHTFTLNGVNSSNTSFTASVTTDNLLKVKIKPLDAGPNTLSNGTSNPFTASYGCVRFTVTVNGRSADTAIMKVAGANNGLCPNAPSSYTMDFSDRLVAGGAAPTVRVSNPRYDFYCQYYTNMAGCQNYVGYYDASCVAMVSSFYPGQCTVRQVYQTHSVRGQVDIYTN